jgi:peptidoglycan hydrolase-like protein with peptidoglycan-binding domain
MRGHVDGAKPTAQGRSGGVGRADETGAQRAGMPRKRAIPLGVLLAVVVAGLVLALAHDHKVGEAIGSGPASAAAPTAAATPLPPTRLVALPPRKIVNGTQPLSVTLSAPVAPGSAPVAPGSPPPTLRPAVAGTWATVGDSEVFTPASTLQPCSTYTLTVWANTFAVEHSRLGTRRTLGLQVACPPIAALQQALARLGYLGASFRSFYGVHISSGRETRQEAAGRAFHPPRGRLVPDPSTAPAVQTGKLDEVTKGALEVYQADRGLEPTGEPNYATWASLLASETADRRNPKPYTWVSVSESIPESLQVHRGDRVVFSTPANTGVPGAETAQGVFAIFARDVSTTMTGTDPDGTHYVAPDVPWVNYFNGGDAVHGYPRASYGSPQSNGCVELPIEAAHTVYGMLSIGDIVEVGG